MKLHVRGTVDDDQVLSLRLGNAVGESLPERVENILCDMFWNGDMQLRLIGAFSRGNKTVDFELAAEYFQLTENTLLADLLKGKEDWYIAWTDCEVDGWPIDMEWIETQLQLNVSFHSGRS